MKVMRTIIKQMSIGQCNTLKFTIILYTWPSWSTAFFESKTKLALSIEGLLSIPKLDAIQWSPPHQHYKGENKQFLRQQNTFDIS